VGEVRFSWAQLGLHISAWGAIPGLHEPMWRPTNHAELSRVSGHVPRFQTVRRCLIRYSCHVQAAVHLWTILKAYGDGVDVALVLECGAHRQATGADEPFLGEVMGELRGREWGVVQLAYDMELLAEIMRRYTSGLVEQGRRVLPRDHKAMADASLTGERM
jgi:hypothetical protein